MRWKDRLTDPAPDPLTLNEANNKGMMAWALACSAEDQRKLKALATGAPLVAAQVGAEMWLITLTSPDTGEVFSGCFGTPTPDRGSF